MNKNVLLWLIVIGCSLGVSMGMMKTTENSTSVLADQGTKALSRHKRYMAFPEGSSLSVRMRWFNEFIFVSKSIFRSPSVPLSDMLGILSTYTSVGVLIGGLHMSYRIKRGLLIIENKLKKNVNRNCNADTGENCTTKWNWPLISKWNLLNTQSIKFLRLFRSSEWATTASIVYCVLYVKVHNISTKRERIWLKSWFEPYFRYQRQKYCRSNTIRFWNTI